MKSILKIVLIFFLLVSFVYTICSLYKDVFYVQLGYFIGINIVFIIVKGFKIYWNLVKYWLRLSVFILLLYWAFWNINDGIKSVLLLINTVLSIELIIFILTINDILALPISIKYLKFIILTRALFIQATARFDDNKILIKTIPEFQEKYKFGLKGLQLLFYKNIILSMTFAFFILEQSTILGELIDNRIAHTNK